MPTKPTRDITKLPQWAQWEIERLQRNEEYALKKQAEAEAGFMERGSLVSDTGRIDWTVKRDGTFHLAAYDGRLVVLPQASNCVDLRIERY